jgi:hypothetical protein
MFMQKRSRIVLLCVFLVVLIAGAAISLDVQAWRGGETEDMQVFQKAVGGLGMDGIASPI